MFSRKILVLVLILPSAIAAARPLPVTISGYVFEDRDGDGRMGPEEPGLAGVVVSDQMQAVASGPDGAYLLEGDGGYGLIFVCLPAGYRPVGSFWRKIPAGPGDSRVDFPLAPAALAEEFSFLHASDTHVSESSLPRLRRLKDIVENRKPAFVLITGDLVRDALRVSEQEALSYFQLYLRETSLFPVPVWSVPGNHDYFGIERHPSLVPPDHALYGEKMYREYLGPNYYSFNFGRVHFVGLDTVDVEDSWYYGQLDQEQLNWLERDLSLLPAGTTVVTFNHIPFFSAATALWGYDDAGFGPNLITVKGRRLFRHTVSNADEVLRLLSRCRHTLALGGHIHGGERIQFEDGRQRTRFYQVAAVVGPDTGVLEMVSGVRLYRVRGQEIDDGEFMPLDGEESRR